jgi:hypothetical protein
VLRTRLTVTKTWTTGLFRASRPPVELATCRFFLRTTGGGAGVLSAERRGGPPTGPICTTGLQPASLFLQRRTALEFFRILKSFNSISPTRIRPLSAAMLWAVVLAISSFQPAPQWFDGNINNTEYSESRARKFLQFSAAAYCDTSDISNWTCKHCQAADSTFTPKVFTDIKTSTQAHVGMSRSAIT